MAKPTIQRRVGTFGHSTFPQTRCLTANRQATLHTGSTLRSPSAWRRRRGASFCTHIVRYSTSQLERQCLLSTLSEHMLRQTFGFRPRRGGTLAASRSALDTVREYLDARWVSPVSLDELAAVAGLSRYHLLRSFRMRFGLPPHAYQNQLRVRHAKELLFQGAAITKAALESGFYDQAHLTNVLRRHTGVTPARLQQQELCA